MKLSILERLLLMQILPKDGMSSVQVKIVKDLFDALGFSEKEVKTYKIKEVENNGKTSVAWNDNKGYTKDVPIGDIGTIVIKDALKKLSDSKALDLSFLSLLDKFPIDGDDNVNSAAPKTPSE